MVEVNAGRKASARAMIDQLPLIGSRPRRWGSAGEGHRLNMNVNIPAIELLLKYTASGIGSVAGPMLAPWRAGREAKAKQIAARGDVETRKILSEGQADTVHIIASAQAEALGILASPDFNVRGEIEINDAIAQRIQFQEEKRQSNIRTVVRQAALQLGEQELPDSEPNHDWTARFFNEVPDVSSDEIQLLWAKVLAGEVKCPGNTSLLTLDILRNLDQVTALLFRKLCSACVSIMVREHTIDCRVPSLGGNAASNSLEQYGLGFNSLNRLNEHGLIISDYNSWFDYQVCIVNQSESKQPLLAFTFQDQHWALVSTAQRQGREFRLSGVALTQSGRELSRIVGLEPMDDYVQGLREFFGRKNLQMGIVENWNPMLV